MITLNEIILIAGMVAVTFGVRYIPLLIMGRLNLPTRVMNGLRYVPVAVLTAITVPAMIMPQGTVNIQFANAYLYGGIAGVIIAWRTRNLLYTIVGSMVVFLLWRVLAGA